jgi:hypothetical protein
MGWHGQHLATYLEHGIAWPWASLGTRWPSSRTMDEHWVTHNFAVQVCPARQHSTKCQMTLRIATGPKISENIVKSPKMILKRRCKLQTSWSSCRCMSMHVDAMIRWWQTKKSCPCHALVMPLSCPCPASSSELLKLLHEAPTRSKSADSRLIRTRLAETKGPRARGWHSVAERY